MYVTGFLSFSDTYRKKNYVKQAGSVIRQKTAFSIGDGVILE